MILCNPILFLHRALLSVTHRLGGAVCPGIDPRGRRLWLVHLLVLAVAIGFFPRPARAMQGLPAEPTSAPAGSSIAVGDLNGDGFLDIIQGNNGQSYLYLNDGQGHFPATGIRFGQNNAGDKKTPIMVSVAVGDLNGDGLLDIVQSSSFYDADADTYASAQSYVYLNEGKGRFPDIGTPFGSNQHTVSIAVGDLNGDGFLDIVQGNGIYERATNTYMAAQSYFYLNDGQGHFPEAMRQPLGVEQRTVRVAVGDLNGDGLLDIVQANSDQSYVYLNEGQGRFSANGIFRSIGKEPASVALGDFNGDGFLDIVQSNYGNKQGERSLAQDDGDDVLSTAQSASSNKPVGQSSVQNGSGQNYVYLNDGRGNFPIGIPLASSTVDICHGSVAVGDLNRDGAPDIVVGNRCYTPNEIYLNDGTGNFAAGILFGDADVTQSVALGDLDNDGKLDIVVNKEGGRYLVYPNDREIQFAAGTSLGSSDYTNSVAVGDLNGDDALDLVVGNGGALYANPYRQNLVYFNQGTGTFAAGAPLPTTRNTRSVAVGDLNGDGALDIVVGNDSYPNQIYFNDGTGHFPRDTPFPVTNNTQSVAVGDLNGDGALDIIVGNYDPSHIQSNLIYLNDGQGNFDHFTSFGPTALTRSVAVGDLNGDGALDIVVGNERRPIIYLNDGVGNFHAGEVNCGEPTADIRCLDSSESVTSIALGDLDSNGTLDIVIGNDHQANLIYLNEGQGRFRQGRPFGDIYNTYSVAVGDLNSDGALDIVVGVGRAATRFPPLQDRVFLNDGNGNFPTGASLAGTDFTHSVAVGDFNGDGWLDIVVGNGQDRDQMNRVYLNQMSLRAGLTNNEALLTVMRPVPTGNANFFSSPTVLVSPTIPITYTLFDPEGDRIGHVEAAYSLDGGGNWLPAVATHDTATQNLTTGRVIGRALTTPLLIPAQASGPLKATLTVSEALSIANGEVWFIIDHPHNADLAITLQSPQKTVMDLPAAAQATGQKFQTTPFAALAKVLLSATVPYTDAYRLIEPLPAIRGEKTDGTWTLMITNTGTSTSTLAAWGLWLKTPPAVHVFNWDTFASGFFGQSDNVVIRMRAYAQPTATPRLTTTPLTGTYRYTNSVASSYQWAYAGATTFPFRVRGTQVQVYQSTSTTPTPVSNAIVYHLPTTASHGAQLLTDAIGRPFITDAHGYLQGRGQIAQGAHLVALLPITHTAAYTLYYTSATPTVTGLDMYTMTTPGVQRLTVKAEHPLLLFNLTVALEWDARNDARYRDQLRADLQRTSELLYQWTNGQAALGNVTIYDSRQHWNDAHIRILASNRLRPNADMGGVVNTPITETVTITQQAIMTTATLAYYPGQVRMPVEWNRFGAADSGNLGEDWPRTLAHELGHYLFFLHDNYWGFDEMGQAIAINPSACPGVMSDPYRKDHFVLAIGWPAPGCEDTASNRSAGRADWSTIGLWYSSLITPTLPYTGPNRLPLAVTQITFDPAAPVASTALAVPIFALVDDETNKPYLPGRQARAFLFAEDQLIDLGRPIGERIKAWGASPGQRLCLFDLLQQLGGCQTLAPDTAELRIKHNKSWQPDVTLLPALSHTLQITVTGVTTDLQLYARLYPMNAVSVTEQYTIPLTVTADGYTGEFRDIARTFEAYIHLWATDPLAGTRYELITDFTVGGNPTSSDTSPTGPYVCHQYNASGHCVYAPVLSGDGQAMLLGANLDLAAGQFYAIQTVTQIPPAPPWMTVVGQAYRLLASTGVSTLTNASLSLSYLPGEIPPGEEAGLQIYYYNHDPNINAWQPLPTTRSEINSAVAPITKPGLYVLMSSLEVPLANLGWNLIGYPVQLSQPVTVALQSITGTYKTVYGYDATDHTDPWKIYDPALPAAFNDLHALKFGQGYWIDITRTLTTTPVLHFKNVMTETQPITLSPAALISSLYPPPATYYGAIRVHDPLALTAGMTVTAYIDGIACGTGTTQAVADEILYSVKVRAANWVNPDEIRCGAPDRLITFTVGTQMMGNQVRWDNNQVQEVMLSQAE